ncbi:aminotransferase class I/II-fold pyridoxal phosphate-dependent enzyme [Spiroplasma tabanidicola]|uniref:aminotransferase class I/II-fold pyridoxal phosphate-dependent enzyme n=1 Tax=Spiroplasma tabanidicola TaxID=324079 RepID=UPI0031B60449
MEQKLANSKAKLLILCNPHNPIGKVWDKETLEKIGELCLKHNVTILSDEIHCDITYKKNKYIPMASVSDKIANIIITCVSMSKAFNLTGLQSSAIIIKNEEIKKSRKSNKHRWSSRTKYFSYTSFWSCNKIKSVTR